MGWSSLVTEITVNYAYLRLKLKGVRLFGRIPSAGRQRVRARGRSKCEQIVGKTLARGGTWKSALQDLICARALTPDKAPLAFGGKMLWYETACAIVKKH